MAKTAKRSKRSKAVDVRSTKDVPALESVIKTGPITVVLIYADWCGHCTNFKKNVWSKLLKNQRPNQAKLASIHHDQLENTILRDAKIRGYPSVLVVGKDGKPAVFKGPEEEETNAMPETDLQTLEKIVNADAKTILRESEDATASMMTPPDVREDHTRDDRRQDGGSLFNLLKKASNAISRFSKTAKRALTRRR